MIGCKKKYKVKPWGKVYEVEVSVLNYSAYGNLAIRLDSEEGPFAIITVNIDKLPEGYAYLDTNNCPWAEEFVTENGLGEFTGEYATSGYCEYPLYRFDVENLRKAVMR